MIVVRSMVMCFVVLVLAWRARAANLVVNGGFETGDFSGWTVQGAPIGSAFGVTSTDPHEGTYSAAFAAITGQSDQIWQTIPTAAGLRLKVSFWVFNYGLAGDSLVVKWNGQTLQASTPISVPEMVWTQMSFDVMTVSNTSELRFLIYDGPAFVFIDDVVIESDNLIVNPSFETGDFTGWETLPGDTPFFGLLSMPHTGAYRVFLASSGPSHDEIRQLAPTVPGRVYLLQFWMRNDSYGGDGLRVWWEGHPVFDAAPCPMAAEWVPISLFVTSTTSPSELRIGGFDAPAVFSIDDVYLGQPGNPTCAQDGDADNNGEVNFADITAVLRNWGAMCVP